MQSAAVRSTHRRVRVTLLQGNLGQSLEGIVTKRKRRAERSLVSNPPAGHLFSAFRHIKKPGKGTYWYADRRSVMDLRTKTRQAGPVTIVDISGRIVLGEESAALRGIIVDLLNRGQKQILLNLGNVSYIDSSGLGSLVSAFSSVRKQGGELKLLSLTNKAHDALQITKLYTVFDIKDDEAEAIKSFDQSKAVGA